MSEFENNATPEGPQINIELVHDLQRKAEDLQGSLDYARQRLSDLDERHTTHINNWRNRLNEANAKAERRFEFLTRALSDAYGDADKFDHTHADVQRLILGALRTAKLRGLMSDGERIANALDASQMWEALRESDDYSTVNLTSDEIRERLQNEIAMTMSVITVHPRDPRFSEVWERATKLAQEHDLCSEYDAIAGQFDIPTDQEFDYEGEVTVRYSGYATIPVSGRATRLEIQNGDVAYSDIDTSDIVENIDHYSLEFDVDETNITVS